ncbi:uncharacterized protein LOC105156912 isoform X1 [Sesamum indicum]|uniref:Uncharacterized protein LOC105156912 isoform X1 n=1 Tax=Sesamum indicum TaxID=4182 RepID=A0A6I9SQH7_SESIN|nr:uncharacterized protein LOC105156912 isoform X1 [Sesamum indicum]
MQAIGVLSKSRRVARVLENPSRSLFNSAERVKSSQQGLAIENADSLPLRRRFHYAALLSANILRSCSQIELNHKKEFIQIPSSSMVMPTRLFSSEAQEIGNDTADAETVKTVYDKMLNCIVERRTAPPNAWLWSIAAKCSTHEDIKLLFDILQKLRTFKLSNLRIHDDFNSALCREVTKACVRAGAIDFGMKTLWKHNLFGLTPDIGSAHHLLSYAKQHNDVKLMVKLLKLMKKNDLPFQPGTADIVFSICYSTDRLGLTTKHAKRFVKSGVNLRQTSFDLLMEFAARKADLKSLWKIEKWRSKAMKKHSLSTGFSCAKGFLLEHKPESAAAIIQVLYQTLPEAKRPTVMVELQKLVSEWPLEIIKHQKEDRKAFAAALQNDISALINALPSLGVEANVSMQDLTGKEAVLS